MMMTRADVTVRDGYRRGAAVKRRRECNRPDRLDDIGSGVITFWLRARCHHVPQDQDVKFFEAVAFAEKSVSLVT